MRIGRIRSMLPEVHTEFRISMHLTDLNHRGSPSASTDEIMLIQETLAVKGLYSGEIDGIPGKETLRAVRAYKRTQQMPVNNLLSKEFIAHIRHEA